VTHVLPTKLPDLYRGEQLVVLGQYHGSEKLIFALHGDYLGQHRWFRFECSLEGATTRNVFVPRLWASRQIAELVDAIRQLGADSPATAAAAAKHDPRLAELTQEILRLSTEHGILTEYTAFLAREGTDLSRPDEVLAQASANFRNRAMATRSGLGAISQSANHASQARQSALNMNNSFLDENMNRVSIATVQQMNDRAFFRRGQRWVDSRALAQEATAAPQRTIAFGSPEFAKLAARLAGEGRAGCLALEGDLLLLVDGERVLVTKQP
jgi:Ca-activated chloride channel family protein